MTQEEIKQNLTNILKNIGLSADLNNPKTIQEKIQWLKIYDSTPLKTKCADKIKIHEYCIEKLGKDICIPIYKIYDKPEDIVFEMLPSKFVIKCNHGCGYNIIVKDKNNINEIEIINTLNQWLNENYAFKFGYEMHYSNIERKCFIEKYMYDGHDDLIDYKFNCFNGTPMHLKIISNRKNDTGTLNYYDMNFNLLNISQTDFECNLNHIDKKPKNFELMKEYAKKLSEDFKFVRVDFYEINGEVYLGELTFTPGSGFFKYKNPENEIKIGNLLKL